MRNLILASAAIATVLAGAAPAFADPPRSYSERHDDRYDRRDDRRDDRYDRRDDWRDDRRGYRPDVVVHKSYYYVGGRRYERAYGPSWYAPRGYAHRVWSHGDYVPRGYREVVIVDHGRYHLPAPRRDERWVRVDGDALLIGAATGLVVAAVSGAFY
jgi:Ni/Co efflux regulator RcnB